jgi:hypothetical protein
MRNEPKVESEIALSFIFLILNSVYNAAFYTLNLQYLI